MGVNLISGDFLEMARDNQFDIIGHFCDCEKKWNNTLSAKIKNNYPLSYNIDSDNFPMELGEYSICDEYLFKILNIYVYCHYEEDRHKTVYSAIDQASFNINRKLHSNKIGISYNQIIELDLDWERTKKILIDNFKSVDLYIVEN